MKFISYENAMIVWNTTDDYLSIKELIVYQRTSDDLKNERLFHKGEFDYSPFAKYRRFSLSHGCCSKSWIEGGKDYRLYEAMRLITECKKEETLKTCLFELGKIDEFESIRLLLWNKFPNYLPNLTYNEFIKTIYH